MDTDQPNDGLKITMIGHLLIKDVESGEVIINQRDISRENKEENDTRDI